MSSDMQAFGSWRILLLNPDDLGDADDVLTRVGANGVEFKPGGGGAAWGGITGTLADQTDLQTAIDAKATGNQSVATTADVVFGSVTAVTVDASSGQGKFASVVLGTGPFTSNGDIKSGSAVQWVGRNVADSGDRNLFAYSNDVVQVGDAGIDQSVLTGVEIILQFQDGFIGGSSTEINLFTSNGQPINLTTSGALNINGTPGVTAGPFTTITSITVTKGIITALTGT